MVERSVGKIIKKLAIKSKVNINISPHSFRRSFATNHHRHGVPILIISRMMGHSKIKTTERYILLNEDDFLTRPTSLGYLKEED